MWQKIKIFFKTMYSLMFLVMFGLFLTQIWDGEGQKAVMTGIGLMFMLNAAIGE